MFATAQHESTKSTDGKIFRCLSFEEEKHREKDFMNKFQRKKKEMKSSHETSESLRPVPEPAFGPIKFLVRGNRGIYDSQMFNAINLHLFEVFIRAGGSFGGTRMLAFRSDEASVIY